MSALDGKGLGSPLRIAWLVGPTIAELVDNRQPCAPCTHVAGAHVSDAGRVEERPQRRIPRRRPVDKVTGAVVGDAVDAYMRYAKGKRAIFFGYTSES